LEESITLTTGSGARGEEEEEEMLPTPGKIVNVNLEAELFSRWHI
jgi:hypothetical protein